MRLECHLLLRLEVSVNDAQAMQVIQAQSQLSQVELHVLLREHNLQGGRGFSWIPSSGAGVLGSRQLPGPEVPPWGGPSGTPVSPTLLFIKGFEV